MVRVRIQGRLAAASGDVRSPQSKGDLPHGGRGGRNAPGAGKRDCPARPRAGGARPDVDAAVLHDAGTRAEELYRLGLNHRARYWRTASRLQCVLAAGYTTDTPDSAGAWLHLLH